MKLAFPSFNNVNPYNKCDSSLNLRRRRKRSIALKRMSRIRSSLPRRCYRVIGFLILFSVVLDLCLSMFGCKYSGYFLWTLKTFSSKNGLLSNDEPSLSSHQPHEPETIEGLSAGMEMKRKDTAEHQDISKDSDSLGPPSYLPLAQHLKYVNYTGKRTSIQDMAFGAQKRTYPDLEPTNNFDLLNCAKCSENCKLLGYDIPPTDHQLQLARLAVRLVTFYNLSSMLVLPCVDEVGWTLPVTAAIRKFKPSFKMYCAVSSDKVVVDLLRTNERRLLKGSNFVVYQPMTHGDFPKVDVMFTWRGLEQFDLDAIHEVFKRAVSKEIKYILVGNSPGYANARMVETGSATFSIKRPEVPALNVRGYPFGFNKALRVFPLDGKQLLFYRTHEMRGRW